MYQQTTKPVYPLQGQRPAKQKPKAWLWVLVGVVALVAVCGIVGAIASAGKTPQVQPIATATGEGAQSVGSAPAKAAPPAPIVIAGKNNTVLPIGSKLNGAFTVDYSFGSWCGIANFLKADGSNGAGLMEDVNDCTGDFKTKLVGKTVIHLKDVTMVKVDNTNGAWSLTLTPLGG